jgi:hypothetical protein
VLEVKIDEYAHTLVKNVGNLNRSDIEKKLGELIESAEVPTSAVVSNSK